MELLNPKAFTLLFNDCLLVAIIKKHLHLEMNTDPSEWK